MKICLLDTGPMVAMFDNSDNYHIKTLEFVKSFSGSFVTSLASITEAFYLLGFNQHAQKSLLVWISLGGVEVEQINKLDIQKIIQVFEKYSDLPMDFADGCLIAIAERLEISDIATIDNDFAIYRLQKNKSFKIHIGN